MIDESLFDDFPATRDKNSQLVIEMKKSGNGESYYFDFSDPHIEPSLPLNTSPLQHIVNPTGIGIASFGQLPPMNVIIPTRIYDVPYPENQDEVQARASIRRKCLQHFLKFKRQIFGGIKGVRSSDGSCIEYGSIKVSLKGFWNSNLYIPPGGAINTLTGIYALDPIELLSMVNGCNYKKTLELLTYFFKSDQYGNNSTTYEKESVEWANETKRVVQACFKSLKYLFDEPLCHFVYRNEINDSIAIVSYIKHLNGITTYHMNTLWKHKRTGLLHWFEIHPYVFPLFNQNNIYSNKSAEIIFVDSEIHVVSKQKQNELHEKVFTTCFGGHKNLLKADLKPLSGRTVIIACSANGPEIQLIPPIIIKLSNAQLKELYFTFDNNINRVSANEFMEKPGDWGCNYIDQVIPRIANPITKAGEMLPGSETKRKDLIQPIIKEGYIVWLYAASKIGKTWLALFIACMASRGSSTFGSWTCKEPVGVLYIDIESLPDEFVNCCTMVMKGQSHQSNGIPFRVFSAKAQPEGEIDIMSEDCQRLIESELDGINMIIIDNFYSATDNQPSSIKPVLRWLSKLSQKGIAIIVVDHTNREGELQGSISKERAANLSIKLEQHPDYEDQIIVSYPVARSLPQKDAKPFTLRKVFTEDSFKFELVEEHKVEAPLIPEKIKTFAKVMFLKTSKKMTYENIAKETELSKSAISKYINDTIPALTGKNKKMYEEELSRLIAEDEMATIK